MASDIILVTSAEDRLLKEVKPLIQQGKLKEVQEKWKNSAIGHPKCVRAFYYIYQRRYCNSGIGKEEGGEVCSFFTDVIFLYLAV